MEKIFQKIISELRGIVLKNNYYCPYCHPSDPKPLNVETIKYSGLELKIVGRSQILRCRSFEDDDCLHFDTQDCVIINYCPMCGRDVHEITVL